jgi:DNA-binding MarR family transcriptional regulator
MAKDNHQHLTSTAQSLLFIVGYLQRLLRFEARNEKIGWTALMILKDLDLFGACSQKDLAEIEQVRAPTMTVLIKQMERKGWVRRKVDPEDARAYRVTITAAGRKQLQDTGRTLQQTVEAKLAELPLRDAGTLAASLADLAQALWGGVQQQR